jgi:hypothetical protein
MPITSGKGRLLNGSGGDRVKRSNLTEFRGSLWEAVNDWFFGTLSINYLWDNDTDEDKLTKWIYAQDGTMLGYAEVLETLNQVEMGCISGEDEFFSNQRELWTIIETAPWGIAKAKCEFICGPSYSGVLGIKPQMGIGIRAQDDTQRRTIIAWYDVVIGNPHAINLGVWSGLPDGTGFINRQVNKSFNLGQTYDVVSGSRTSNVVTAEIPGHNLVVGDRLNINWDMDFISVPLVRASNVVTATLPSTNEFEPGDEFATVFSSPGSFDLDPGFISTKPDSTTVTYAQTGANESGSAFLFRSHAGHIQQAMISEVVDAHNVRYPDPRHNIAVMGSSRHFNKRNFPYTMEMRVFGSVVQIRVWDPRFQPLPPWDDDNFALTTDLDRPTTNYSITAGVRTNGISVHTIGAHDIMKGSRVDIDVTDVTYDGSFSVYETTATTVSVRQPGIANDASGGTGTLISYGGGTAAQIADNPTPRGSGRIAMAAAHVGYNPISRCVYGPITATTDIEDPLPIPNIPVVRRRQPMQRGLAII